MNEVRWAEWMVAAQAGEAAACAALLHDGVALLRFVGAGMGVPVCQFDDLVHA